MIYTEYNIEIIVWGIEAVPTS